MSNDLFTVALEYKEVGREELQKNYDNFIQSVNRGSQAENNASKASEQNARSKQRLSRATRDAASAQQRVRQQFLATANSIAVLDGPLGGVASRFSAFGVLVGRIGIPLGALAVGLSTFTFTAQRAIRELAQWEVQVVTIENRLNSLGNQVNLTSQEITRMSEQIGLATLADERQVMAAANQLLTFRNITTDVFEDVLKASQDLAASGFGDLESNATRLAKALEDPRQSLTSLSRAGITFTRAQRDVIIGMVDTGREAEAMRLVLQNVENQVGGAGLAQANDTLAGSFDTIGQAVRTATREFAEFVATELGVRAAINRLAEASARYIESTQETDIQKEIRAATENLSRLNDEIEDLNNLRQAVGHLADQELSTLTDLIIAYGEQSVHLQNLVDQQNQLNHQIQLTKNLQESINQLSRREERLDDLESQVALQRDLVGLTEEEARVRRIMASSGFGGDAWANVNRELIAYRDNLLAAGVSASMVNVAVEQMRNRLEGARDVADRLRQAFEDQRIARQINQIGEATENNNELLRRQVAILEDARAAGDLALTVTEARRRAELEMQIAMVETQKQTYMAAEAAAVLAGNFDAAAEAAANVARMAALINNLNEGIDLQARVANLGRPDRGGGGGGGKDPNAEFQRELDQLNTYLEKRREEFMIANGLERELVVEQYEERFQILQNALDRKLLSEQEYSDKVVALTESREARIAEIERAAANSRLSFIAGIFGDMASAAQAGGDRMIKVQAALAFAQGTINAYLAYTQALADPTIPSTLAKIGLAARVLSLGLNAAAQIKGGGGGGGGRAAAAPRGLREATPQRVIIQGLEPTSLYTGEQLQNLFEAFYQENDNRGKVFVVNR